VPCGFISAACRFTAALRPDDTAKAGGACGFAID
jgi:hypothetical protein